MQAIDGMVRFWSLVLGVGLLGLWLNYVSFVGSRSWILWIDLAVAIAALVAAGLMHPTRSKRLQTGFPAALAAVLFVVWIVALATRGPVDLTWLTFVFALGFAAVSIAASHEATRMVVLHPTTHRGDLPAHIHRDASSPLSQSPERGEMSVREIEDIYGPHNLGGFGYQLRAGYSEPTRGDADDLGEFWGVGPKGYLRSDVKIADEIGERMAKRCDLDASQIEVDVRRGDVTLRGTVDTRASSDLAESICRSTVWVRSVHNELKIVKQAKKAG